MIPKAHHPDAAALAEADPALAGAVLAAAGEVAEAEGVAESGYRLVFNTGPDAGQKVFHVHAHVLGGAPLGPMTLTAEADAEAAADGDARHRPAGAAGPAGPGPGADPGGVGGGAPGRPSAVDIPGGRRRAARTRRSDAGTLFRMGSVTKTFTAVLVMQCRDEGLLDLDDPVGRTCRCRRTAS